MFIKKYRADSTTDKQTATAAFIYDVQKPVVAASTMEKE